MKLFKNHLIICLVTCLIFITVILSACSSRDSTSREETSTANSNILKIGIDAYYEPFSYIDADGNYAGLDIELAKEACERMGMEPSFVSLKWDNKNEYLENGEIDCIWSCFSMNGREADYNWVGPYMKSLQMVVVRDDSDITSLDDLEGRRVAVMSSTKPESIFLEDADDNVPDVKDVYCLENMDIVFATLKAGYVDAVAGHETVVRQYMALDQGTYRLIPEELLSADVGVAFSKGADTEMADKLRETLIAMKKDGTLKKLLGKYGVESIGDMGGDE